MLYLNYAKPIQGGNILNFFADSEKDLEEISNGKKFIANNGTDYGVPVDSSTVIITLPDKTKKTYMLSNGEWIEGVKEEPAFQEEHDITSYGASNEYIRALINSKGIETDEELQEALKTEAFGATKKIGGYFMTNYPEEEGADFNEFGQIMILDGNYSREFLKSGVKYRVRLYPQIFMFPYNVDYGSTNKFYQWVCKYKRVGEYEAYMVNEDCELSDQELRNLSEDADASNPQNPDILFLFTYDTQNGAIPTGTFCESIMTKKECVYFLLEVVEIKE